MPRNKITDLRNLLFETIERCLDKEDPIDVAKAKVIADLGQVIVNSAKVEVDYVLKSGEIATSFIDEPKRLGSDNKLS
jgi:hypothetical protein